MTSPSPTSSRSRILWPLAALLALAGAVLLTLAALGPGGRVTADLVGVHQGAQVEVPASGMSVWSRSVESRTGMVCLLDGDPLLRPVADHSVEIAGELFHETARTPEGLAAGSYTLECPLVEGASVPDDRLYVGPYGPEAVTSGLLGGTGITLGLVLLPLGIICGLLAWSAGRDREEEPEQGPDPGDYTVSEQSAGAAYTSPYATPYSSPGQQGPGPGQGVRAPQTAPGAVPPGGQPEPPAGPRYDLPPPS